jgi:hypothetical protein
MTAEFTDAKVTNLTINVRDERGRRASLTFEDDGLRFHNRRPKQGKTSFVSYAQLLDLAREQNLEFFAQPKRRAHPKA